MSRKHDKLGVYKAPSKNRNTTTYSCPDLPPGLKELYKEACYKAGYSMTEVTTQFFCAFIEKHLGKEKLDEIHYRH